MLFYTIFIHYIAIVSASWDVFNSYFGDYRSYEPEETLRYQRQARDHDYDNYIKTETIPPCKQLGRTSSSPFIVVILYKTSGRYLGMGSIIDKKTILTATKVVVASVHRPSRILSMAGRRNAWWGHGAQVQPASEIFLSGSGLAILKLAKPFRFTRNVMPIQLGMFVPQEEDFLKEFDKHWVVFGIPRSSWNVPGERTPKPNVYILKIETVLEKKEDLQMCEMAFPDLTFNDTTMTCTLANGTFCWGCMGSPVVAMNLKKHVVQIGVVVRATFSEMDQFHALVKIGFYNQWIRSNSLIGFSKPY